MQHICLILLFCIHTQCLENTELKNNILNEISWSAKVKILTGYPKQTNQRRVGIQAYMMKNPSDEEEVFTKPMKTQDENDIKIKLFRLMFETVRDSDLKVKRAEIIKKFHKNSISFNLGYVMGEITERFNVMKDIALTMTRLYEDWKPMEHINAYEQIANRAVELCNMVDIARTMMRQNYSYTGKSKP